MELLPIASAVTVCIKHLYTLTKYIQNLKRGTKTLENLSQEMRLFSKVLQSIDRSLKDDSLVKAARCVYTGHEKKLSQQMEEVLGDCQTTLTDIEVLIGAAKPKGVPGNVMGRVWGQIRLDKIIGDINAQKEKLSSYRETMQTLMQFMILYFTLTYVLTPV